MTAFDKAWRLVKNEDWYVDDEFIISPVGQGKENMMEAFGAFIQDRMNPGCDEAKRVFISQIPESPMKQGIINTTMETSCDTFIAQLEEIEAEPYGPPALIEAAALALAAHRRQAGMDEEMA